MKKLVTTIILMAFAFVGVAQQSAFAPQGAEWYFNLSSFMGSPISYYHMEVLGDTLIQNHQCSIISPQYLGGNGMNQYVYEEDRKVYWYNQTLQDFTTLYDFNAEVGDSWICEIDSCSYVVPVQSVEEVTWGGRTYRVQNIAPIEGEFFYFYYGRIIEGIGSVEGLFPYPYACVGDMYDGPYPDYLRCYHVDGELLYHEGDFECDAVLPWQYPCWDGTVAEAYDGGSGTAEDPYQIATPQQLALLAQQTNDGTGGDAYYLITDDICLNADMDMWTFNWVPIGRVTGSTVAYFRGHFDGNGKTISGLVCETNGMMTDPVIGLFGCTDGAEIRNVNLSNCRLTGRDIVGGLVGYAGLTNIYNCSISDGLVSTANGTAGGLVGRAGYTYGEQGTSSQTYTIKDCVVGEAVKVEGAGAGGVVGKVSDLYKRVPYVIEGCEMQGMDDNYYVYGSINAGGVVCTIWYGTIIRCINNQKVVVTGTSYGGGVVGGIAAAIDYGIIEECINNETGVVVCENNRNVHAGGIVGSFSGSNSNTSDLRGCQNFAEVSGTGCCGGIVGFYFMNHSFTPSFIQNCTNHSRVTSHRPTNATGIEGAGGIIGHIGQAWGNLCIVECSNFGDVVMDSDEQGDAGGILGSREEGHVYIVNAFNRGSVSAPIYAGGIIGGGENLGECIIQNVYNAGEVITGQETMGAIAYNQQETDHFSDCYWLYRENHASVSEGEPLPNACAFHPTESPTDWLLDSIQYGTTDLLDALNYGAQTLVEQYPTVLAMVHRWQPDTDLINDGFPVFSGIEVNYPFIGTEWYYEIENENGSITYQHLEYAADTTVNHKDVVIIIRTNTLYDKSEHQEVTREYVYEENGIIYWWNKDLEEFTALYDFSAEAGDEWEIKVGMESITMHVDSVKYYEYDGELYKMLMVSDEDDIFSGNIVCGIGHQTSFFPERLMTRGKDYRVEGIRCFWRNGELMFKYGDRDCDEVYEEYHNGIEEPMVSEGFIVYPNPTNGLLNVGLSHCGSRQEYRISNPMGQTLMIGNITAENQQIDVSNLPQGMYFITIGEDMRKFVVR